MSDSEKMLEEHLSFLKWIDQLQKEIEVKRTEEAAIHPDTKYIDGFLQCLELVRQKYLYDRGVGLLPPKVYE